MGCLGRVVSSWCSSTPLAVLEASLAAPERERSIRRHAGPTEGAGRHDTRFRRAKARKSAIFEAGNRQIAEIWTELRKSG